MRNFNGSVAVLQASVTSRLNRMGKDATKVGSMSQVSQGVSPVPESGSNPEMPLAFAKQGQTVRVVKIRGGGDLQHHLENLGFVVDSDVRVVSDQGGNLIVEVKGTRVAINRTTANRIVVR